MSAGTSDGRDPLLQRATVIAAYVLLGLVVFLVIAQVIGRVVVGPTFQVGDVLFGGVVGALLAVLGVATVIRYVNKP